MNLGPEGIGRPCTCNDERTSTYPEEQPPASTVLFFEVQEDHCQITGDEVVLVVVKVASADEPIRELKG